MLKLQIVGTIEISAKGTIVRWGLIKRITTFPDFSCFNIAKSYEIVVFEIKTENILIFQSRSPQENILWFENLTFLSVASWFMHAIVLGASSLGSSPGPGNCVVSYIVTKLHHF